MEQRTVNLIKTLSVQTTSYNVKKMNRFIISQASKIKGCDIKELDGNIYITKGQADTYPCIVAHTDTVHDIVKNFKIFKLKDHLFSIDGSTMERVGIGGDDKVGVYIALEILRTIDVCKVAFFRDEEVGCKGSQEADMGFFDNVEFALQCDRKGSSDFVRDIYGTNLYSDEFSHGISGILLKYGRKEVEGGLTDVLQLVENGLGVSVANMSCGYYDPHTNNEYVSISEIQDTLDMVIDIFKAMAGTTWTVDQKDRYLEASNSMDKYVFDRHSGFFNDDNVDKFDPVECKHCKSTDTDIDEYNGSYYCWGCDDYFTKKAS